MKRWMVAVLTLTLLGALPAAAQEDRAAKEKDIRKLLEVTGAAQIGKQVLDQMLESFKTTLPDVPAEFWTEAMKEFDPAVLVERTVPIYDRHFTHQEIQGLIAFYETPLGRKTISVLPAITQESFEIGQQWGLEIANKVQERLKAREKLKNSKGI